MTENIKHTGRILAIDLGIKRTGLAISDELQLTIKHLPNLVAHSRKAAVEALLRIAKEQDLCLIIMGIPEERTEHSRALASRVRGLAQALADILASEGLNTKLLVVDEAHSSRRASRNLALSGIRKNQRKAKLDAASAAILLEDYLESRKEHVEDF